MASNFPEMIVRESQKNQAWARNIMDNAITYYQNNQSTRRVVLDALYESYNGIVKQAYKKLLEEKYGKTSELYKDFKLGRSKLKLLIGEYLSIELDPMVTSVNPDSIKTRVEMANLLRGAVEMKETLTKIKKNVGFDPVGIEIPDANDPNLNSKLYPITENELAMQLIIDDKIKGQKIKFKAQECFVDLLVTSECHGRVERNARGEEVFRPINPKDAIFQEVTNDPFCDDSPFKGERRWMYIKDVVQQFQLTPDQRVMLVNYSTTDTQEKKGFRVINGLPAVEVFTIQWKANRNFYTKISPAKNGSEPYLRTIDPLDFEDNEKEYLNDIANQRYDVMVDYGDELWEGTRIGEAIYVNVGPVPDQIQVLAANGKYFAEYEYVNMLFGTVDGVRISLQELINNLSEVNNVIMFMILRELKKIKGKVFVYDEALKPGKKSMTSLLLDATEHGVIRINSAAEGNYSQRDIENAANVIKELDLGLSASFNILLNLKSDIERTIDRITGINESREGMNKATQTATGTMQNIEASRSITKDIFVAMNEFLNSVLTLLAEKTKLNRPYLRSNRAKFLFGATLLNFIQITEDLMFDDFNVVLSDGRREMEIRERVRPLFDREINAGKLRAKDVIKFELKKNIHEALSVLDNAWNEISQFEEKQNQLQVQANRESLATQLQISREDREDRQAHEKELKLIDVDAKLAVGSQKSAASLESENMKASQQQPGKKTI